MASRERRSLPAGGDGLGDGAVSLCLQPGLRAAAASRALWKPVISAGVIG